MEPVVKNGSFRAYGHTIGPAQVALERWVGGHPCDPRPRRAASMIDREYKGILDIRGVRVEGRDGMSWSVIFGQNGNPKSHGLVCGCASAEDACDRALELIREHEDELLLALVEIELSDV